MLSLNTNIFQGQLTQKSNFPKHVKPKHITHQAINRYPHIQQSYIATEERLRTKKGFLNPSQSGCGNAMVMHGNAMEILWPCHKDVMEMH